ncbi:MAG: glycosyltransferase family 4 protein [Bacteroidales bacterium]|jgi:glycosyltransferase involved in cell wall biosynthesis|nr:glycosyltransferase family 4 protein [Bacteroidales bacterium]
MNVLYLAEDYFTSAVHHHLCEELEKQDVNIQLFTVDRPSNRNRSLILHDTPCQYTLSVSELSGREWLYKAVFPYKINTKYRMLSEKVDTSTIMLTHAATLFSEGALSYKLYKEHKIPYIITIRNSDYFFYAKKMPHLWRQGREILQAAKAIVFITPFYQKIFFSHPFFRDLKDSVLQKSIVISNGVNPFWLENRHIMENLAGEPYKLLYVGRFEDCKNIPSVVKALLKVREQYPNLKLHIVGGTGNRQKEIEKLINRHADCIVWHGIITDKIQLRNIYRSCHIFVMPSFETFGLVYVEALSQGLPILYGKDSGFDGVYPDGMVGFRATKTDSNDIAARIVRLIQARPQILTNIAKLSLDDYQWQNIAKKYKILYETMLKS